jgi:ferredoxin--NADP+ reductase
MMKFCSKTTEPYGVPTLVSLNTIMVDGTGMCGGCRVVVDGAARYVCVDGPEFDGHKVDFDGMMRRQAMYKSEEAASLARYRDAKHTCRLEAPAAASETAVSTESAAGKA